MAAGTNPGFHQGIMPPSAAAASASSSLQSHHHMFSFQPGGDGTTAVAGPLDFGAAAGVFFSGSPGGVVGNSAPAIGGPSSCSAHHLDPAAAVGIQQETGLSSEWTVEEQNTLRQGLIRYAGERGMMKYIKIASMLPRKAVRDVALRCRWLAENSKRRRLEEYYNRKQMHNRKEKMVDSCSNAYRHMVSSGTISSYSPLMPQVNQNDLISSQVSVFDRATQQLMDENNRILQQISNNLSTFQIQENIDLFCHTRNNITTIQNNTSIPPGYMSMPPLPVPLNEELLNILLSCPTQAFVFSSHGIPLEQQTQHGSLL